MAVFRTLTVEEVIGELRDIPGADPVVVDGKLVAVEIGPLRVAATTGAGITIFGKESVGASTGEGDSNV